MDSRSEEGGLTLQWLPPSGNIRMNAVFTRGRTKHVFSLDWSMHLCAPTEHYARLNCFPSSSSCNQCHFRSYIKYVYRSFHMFLFKRHPVYTQSTTGAHNFRCWHDILYVNTLVTSFKWNSHVKVRKMPRNLSRILSIRSLQSIFNNQIFLALE